MPIDNTADAVQLTFLTLGATGASTGPEHKLRGAGVGRAWILLVLSPANSDAPLPDLIDNSKSASHAA